MTLRTREDIGARLVKVSPRLRQLLFHPGNNQIEAISFLKIGENVGPIRALRFCIAVHDFERRADVRRQVDFVDDEQIGANDAGAAFARDLVATRYINDVDRNIRQIGTERGREIIATTFDEDQIDIFRGEFVLPEMGDN